MEKKKKFHNKWMCGFTDERFVSMLIPCVRLCIHV